MGKLMESDWFINELKVGFQWSFTGEKGRGIRNVWKVLEGFFDTKLECFGTKKNITTTRLDKLWNSLEQNWKKETKNKW